MMKLYVCSLHSYWIQPLLAKFSLSAEIISKGLTTSLPYHIIHASSILNSLERLMQDSSIGKSWTHLLPWEHKMYSYIWITTLWKRSKNRMNCLYMRKINRPHLHRSEKQRHGLTPNPTSGMVTYKREGSSPGEMSCWSPSSNVPVLVICTRDEPSKTSGLKNQYCWCPSDPKCYRKCR